MAHRDRAGERVEGGVGPAVVRRGGARHERLAADATGDDDDGTISQSAGDPERPVPHGRHVDLTESEFRCPVRHLPGYDAGHR